MMILLRYYPFFTIMHNCLGFKSQPHPCHAMFALGKLGKLAYALCRPPKSRRPRVYLAGWEVFLTSGLKKRISRQKKEICNKHGLVGVFPGDEDVPGCGESEDDRTALIFKLDVDALKSCDAIVANLSPFRGVGADAGTAWELGHFHGCRLPAVAYTNDPRIYETRWMQDFVEREGGNEEFDNAGLIVDMQSQADNCTLVQGLDFFAKPLSPVAPLHPLDLSMFEEAVAGLARVLHGGADWCRGSCREARGGVASVGLTDCDRRD